jgi:2-phospho-L-lactate guanylyltransferase
MRTNIVIPMKDLLFSKTRLDPQLSSRQRQALALSMFKTTLEFFNLHFSQHHLLVVTASEFISDIARTYGATVLIETKLGLRQAVESAACWSLNNDFQSQLLIPADIAELDRSELERLLTAYRPVPSVVLCPADDLGTNALLTTPPNAIPFLYGIDSSIAHQRAAHERGIDCQVMNLPALALDIDTPDDLELLALLSSPVTQELNKLCKIA